MADASRENRRHKVDLVVLDDDEPAVKSAKKEPEPISTAPDVVELQEKLAKAEKQIERLIKIAADAQSKEEYLANLLDKKPNITDDAKKVEELEKSVNSLKSQLDNERIKLSDLERGNARLEDRIYELTVELGKERKRGMKNRLKDQKRIDELTSQLAKYEGMQHSVEQIPLPPPFPQLQPPPPMQQMQPPPLPMQQMQPPPPPMQQMQPPPPPMQQMQPPPPMLQMQPPPPPMQKMQPPPPVLQKLPPPPHMLQMLPPPPHMLQMLPPPFPMLQMLHPHPPMQHSMNLCELIRGDLPDTISLDEAVYQLRTTFDKCGLRQWGNYAKIAKYNEKYFCEICDKKMDKMSIIQHFLSKGHIAQVRARFSAVSLIALKHWLRELKKAAAASS